VENRESEIQLIKYMRIGRISVTEELLEQDPQEIKDLFDEFDVLDSRASFEYASCVEFLCTHPEFEDIQDGASIPEYRCYFNRQEDGTITRQPFEKI
jgi:hypothetical protein